MRLAAADRAGVGLNGTKTQSATGEDPLVSFIHVVVFAPAVFNIGVKAVSVLHDELTAAHQAESRPGFVAKFGLDLVKIKRQLAIRTHRTTDQIGDDFFMRRAEAEITLVPVFKPYQLLAVFFPAAALLPQLGGRGDRHEQLLRS